VCETGSTLAQEGERKSGDAARESFTKNKKSEPGAKSPNVRLRVPPNVSYYEIVDRFAVAVEM
jgi:hypothetical protein